MRQFLATLVAFFLLTTPAAAAWTWPVSGEVITPYRNGTDPYASGQHRGIDIAAPTGTSVLAAAGGEVRFAGTAGSSGLTVSIRTGDGYDTSYLHLSALAVRAGAHVGAGDRIGAVGTTGSPSATQPHVHFGVREAGSRHAYHDPMSFLPPPPAPPPAPDPPPPATAPEPAPAPPAAAPAPARVPSGAPRAVPRTTPRIAPRAAPRTSPRAAPRQVPHSAPRPAPRGAPSARPRAAPQAAPVRAARPAPGGLRDLRPAQAGAPVSTADGRRAPRAMRAAHAGPHRTGAMAPQARLATPGRKPDPAGAGPNLGWALACAGLLLAAGLLGLTEGGPRRRERRGVRRPRVASMVHAVLRHDAHLLRQR